MVVHWWTLGNDTSAHTCDCRIGRIGRPNEFDPYVRPVFSEMMKTGGRIVNCRHYDIKNVVWRVWRDGGRWLETRGFAVNGDEN